MRIVLDTNVLVSGLLSPYGLCAEITRMISSGELTLCYDSRILAEYIEVLGRPKLQIDPDKASALLDYIESRGQVIAASPISTLLPDLDDQPFLEIAVAGKVTCLITGNLAHFPKEEYRDIKVFDPRGFLDYYRKHLKRLDK